ncbi:vimentin, isoform CRA_c [Rattus norvegicus]|uniref:Vimentin, isoform CRA_c n=1 Tax=Rattus norvegicus TaxID=10116 RepID=A6JM45_RAT|nr:vimentin, isoform CRA_c [Rattus norvegicus]
MKRSRSCRPRFRNSMSRSMWTFPSLTSPLPCVMSASSMKVWLPRTSRRPRNGTSPSLLTSLRLPTGTTMPCARQSRSQTNTGDRCSHSPAKWMPLKALMSPWSARCVKWKRILPLKLLTTRTLLAACRMRSRT